MTDTAEQQAPETVQYPGRWRSWAIPAGIITVAMAVILSCVAVVTHMVPPSPLSALTSTPNFPPPPKDKPLVSVTLYGKEVTVTIPVTIGLSLEGNTLRAQTNTFNLLKWSYEEYPHTDFVRVYGSVLDETAFYFLYTADTLRTLDFQSLTPKTIWSMADEQYVNRDVLPV